MMKKKTILVMTAALAMIFGSAGDTAPFLLDTVTTSTSPVTDSISISWDASWIGGDANATVVIADNGTEVKRTTGTGEFTHSFSGDVRHDLTYTTYIGGVVQSEVYAITAYTKYEVSFDANGGSSDEAIRYVTPGNAIGTLPEPVRTGYTFAGWWTSASGGTQITASATISGHVTYYAHWTVNTYAVTFDANGGTVGTTSASRDYDQTIGTLPTPTRKGYTFAGWWTSASGGTQITSETTVAGDVTYYAHWMVNKYTVTFNANGGTEGTTSVSRDYDQTIGTLPTPIRTGYTFAGWWTSASGGTQISSSEKVTGNVTYYAHWTINQYTVTFNANGGTVGTTSMARDYGQPVGTLPTPTHTDYNTFAGWWTSASGGTQIASATTVTGNVTYYAHWKNMYTVTFDANGGSGGTTKTLEYGTSLTAPTVTRTGYTFMGWSPAVPSTVPAGNVTHTAQWQVNQYTVTFEGNGGALGESALPRIVASQDYGTSIVAPTVTREWFTFMGWSPAVAATVPANNVTYTARWRRYGDSISASKMGGKTMKQLYPADYAHMTTVVLEEGIAELPTGFFDGCSEVVSVTLPSTLVEFGIDDLPTKIRDSLAYDEDGFMIYNGWILDYQNRNASAVTIPEGIVGIGRGAFAEMYDLETVTMPESLRSIAKGAFEDSSWIQNLQFMSGLRYVGPVAFRGCSSLMGASFADGVENLGTNVFEDCWQMQSVRLPYTVTNIGVKAFTGCSAIRGVTVPTHLKTMQELFPASYSQIETAEVAEGETTVMNDMFAGCVALRGGATQTDMSMIPNTVTNIGARAFQGCTSLTAFVVPDSVVQIGESVFQGCSSLWNVTLSRNLTEIPDYAFYGCSMLETMVVPESVTYLGNRFFSGRTDSAPGIVIENALYYLCTNAPDCHADAYAAIAGNMTTYVVQGSRSWDGRQGSRVLPQEWNGYAITYWTPNRFDVTFDANGGRFGSSGGSTWSEQQITDTTYALPSTEPTRSGWVFEGWWTEQTGGAEVRYTTLVAATRPHTLYAHWRSLRNSMTVTFNSNGGTVVTPGTKNYVPGQTFGQFPVPTRRGYSFQGWWTEAVNGIRMTEATQVPAADMELFAHWSPITYYVRFHANGGSGTMSDQTFTYDVSGALKTHAFTRTGFAFTGWATTPSGQVRYAENASVVNLAEVQDEVVNLYAVWSGVGYSVRFDSNGGTGTMDNQTIAVGETQNLRFCAFARSGYTFAGWAVSPTDAEAKKVTYLDGAAVKNLATSNGAVVPLYAVWVAGGQTVRITFDANGGSVTPDYWNCEVGTAVEAFPTPTRPGFTFAGWWTAKTGGTQVSSITRVASAQTLYAHWTSNGGVDPGEGSCTVTFNANGGSVTETVRTVEVGTAVGTLPTPTRSGYTFDGWYTAASGGTKITTSTKVTGNVTYYAHWNANTTPTTAGTYCVIDLSAGASASKYPVAYLDAIPAGGWTDEYKTTKLVLKKVEAGSFMMDDVDYDGDRPRVVGSYKVSITKPYYIGVFEVTQKQYELVTGQNPSRYKGDMRPVERVSWDTIRGNVRTYNWPAVKTVDANSFIGRLRARSGVSVDLPTLAQGEYAFRAGGGSAVNVTACGRIPENANDGKGGYGEHTKVGSYAPNAWGIYDMYGNVSEWTLDWEWYVTKAVTDPVGPNSSADESKMLGGASWTESYDQEYWYWGGLGTVNSSDAAGDIGFRIAAVVPPGPEPEPVYEVAFAVSEVAVTENANAVVHVMGGSPERASSVKVYLTYNTATAADVNLGTMKFPVTLKWAKGDVGKKAITIPVKKDALVEGEELFTLQLAAANGVEMGGRTVCTVRIADAQWPEGMTPEETAARGLAALPAGATAVKDAAGTVTGYFTKKDKKGNVTAKAMPGYIFTGWYDAKGKKVGSKAALADKTRKSKKATPRFAVAHYLRGLADPANGGKVTGSGKYAERKSVTLKATPNKYWTFEGWYAAVAGRPPYQGDAPISKSKSLKVSVTNELTYLAMFKPYPKVTVAVDNKSGGTVKGAGSYLAGKTVTLTATPKKGYAFCGWFDADGNLVSLNASYKYKVTADGLALQASFKKESALAKPELTWDGETNLTVGVSYSAKLTVKGESLVSVTKVTGLPKGLTFKSGKVTGVPTVAKAVMAKVTVALKSNAKKTWTYSVKLNVAALPTWAVGTFKGTLYDGSGESAAAKGTVTLTVGKTGKVSGKFVDTKKKAYSFTASSFKTYDEDGVLRTKATMKYGTKSVAVEIAVASEEKPGEAGATTLVGIAEVGSTAAPFSGQSAILEK